MGNGTESIKKTMADKAKTEAAQKKFQTLKNQVYRPDAEVTLTGQEFYALFQFISDIRNKNIIVVVDQGGNMIGQALNPLFQEIENPFSLLSQLHEKNYENGVTVDREILIKEYQEEQKKATNPVNVNESVDVDTPLVPEEVEEFKEQDNSEHAVDNSEHAVDNSEQSVDNSEQSVDNSESNGTNEQEKAVNTDS